MKTEGLDWLASNPFCTARFARHVGRCCRSSPLAEVVEELGLNWHTVKDLDKDYMREQLAMAGPPSPRVIGIDELGVEAYCHGENKLALGFVVSLNNCIRVLQRRAYGYCDEGYFRLKILTCMLPKL